MPFHQVRRDPAFREYSSSFCGTCLGSNSLDGRTKLSAGLQAPRRPWKRLHFRMCFRFPAGRDYLVKQHRLDGTFPRRMSDGRTALRGCSKPGTYQWMKAGLNVAICGSIFLALLLLHR
ncbi:hypothetical protein BT69DRAFT_75891 [Atractiella rhizophila]|nr:hypothetical protein BT69DRAFT_75891 [Atractiella rhizophila]